MILVCCHVTFAPYLADWRSTDANQFPRHPYGERDDTPTPLGLDEVSCVSVLA